MKRRSACASAALRYCSLILPGELRSAFGQAGSQVAFRPEQRLPAALATGIVRTMMMGLQEVESAGV